MDRHLVISSDCHAGLPPEQYRDYLDPAYRDAFDVALPIQIEETEKAAKKFLVADINADWRKGREEGLSGAWDHGQRVKVMDGDGVAGEVIFPDGVTEMNMPPFGAGLALSTDDPIVPELQWAGARAHNRWVAELCQMDPARRAGLAICPMLWDVDEAVKEVHWAREKGLRGILIPTAWGKLDAYHHPKYDPVWAACQDQGMVVNLHCAAAPMADYGEEQGMMGIYISEVCWYAYRPLTFMIWGGVFERFPKLKLMVTEATSVWVPEYVKLLDFRYVDTPYSAKLGDYTSHLKSKPSEYFARNVMVGSSCMPRREAELRHEIGIGNLAWGSDYPHPEGAWPNTHQQMRDTFHDLPEDETAKMLGGNLLRFFDFDPKALAKVAAEIGPLKSAFRS